MINFIPLYESLIKSLYVISNAQEVFEMYPQYNTYSVFNTIYLENYTTYKRNPSTFNKGKMEALWNIMVELLGQYKANEIRNKTITRFNQNKNK